jgi:hypothetical protein
VAGNELLQDADFVARVRRHKPSSLVPLIAWAAAQYWQKGSWLDSPYKKFTPWALADIARVSLISGNEQRQDATVEDLLWCSNDYVASEDPELSSDDPSTIAGFLLRKMSEQMVFQQSNFHELGRSAALFEQTTPAGELKVIKPGWDQQLFGCSLSQYVGIGFIAHTGAVKNHGRFSAGWFNDPILEPIMSHIPADLMGDVLEREFIGSTQFFRGKRGPTVAEPFRRFTFNPLLGRPIVSGIGTDLLVPVPGQVIRKVSPLGIWYSGYERWGNPFAEDIGDLFEQYVGRQLKTIPSAQVHHEIVYGPENKRSVDWIVVCNNAVLLIEVKGVRPTDPVRLGKPAAWAELTKKIGKAYQQIENTEQLIAAGQTEFSQIPTNLPRLGLIVTMEPFPMVNAPPIRQKFAPTVFIPTAVCWSEELEWALMLKDKPIDTYLLELLTDPAKEGWDVSADLVGIEMGRNKVLDQAWDSYQWGKPPAGWEDLQTSAAVSRL